MTSYYVAVLYSDGVDSAVRCYYLGQSEESYREYLAEAFDDGYRILCEHQGSGYVTSYISPGGEARWEP